MRGFFYFIRLASLLGGDSSAERIVSFADRGNLFPKYEESSAPLRFLFEILVPVYTSFTMSEMFTLGARARYFGYRETTILTP